MNILIIDNSIAFTGALKCAVNEAEILSHKHRFIFVLNHHSNQVKALRDKGYTVYTLPLVEIKKSLAILLLYPIMLFRNSFNLKKIIKIEQIDTIQVNDFYNMLGVSSKLLGFKGKLFTYVRFLPSVMPGILRKYWIKLGLKHSDYIIAVSDAVLAQLPTSKNVIRIYDPVHLSERLPVKSYQQADNVHLLYLANYIQGKGQEYAIEAFAIAYRKNKSLRLTFMGGDMGLEKNMEYKKSLETSVKDKGLSEVITFAPFNANVEAAIKQADIILNFSEAESFSMTCLEAAYYGTALIATRCGGPEEIVNDGKTGITVPVKDTNAMAGAINKLAEDFDLRVLYAKNGKEYVTNKFSTSQYRQAMEKIIPEK